MLALLLMLAVTESPVEPFHYNLSMTARPQKGFISKTARRDTFYLDFVAASVDQIGRDEAGQYVFALASQSSDGVTVIAREQHDLSNERGISPDQFPEQRPQNGFRFKLEALTIPASGSLPLRVQFKDHVDEFSLRHDEKGLHLEAKQSEFGTSTSEPVPFKIVSVHVDGVIYQCSPFGLSAFVDGERKWSTDLRLHKEPDSIKVVGDTIYITTTGGYSLYALKNTGALLTQHTALLGGVDPVGETIDAGVALAKLPFEKRVGEPLVNFYQTGVVLEDRRVIPFLIESVNFGFGLPDKMMAIAGLEKFNGNADAWKSSYKVKGNAIYKSVDMSRVFPAAANKVECDRWREVFKDEPGVER